MTLTIRSQAQAPEIAGLMQFGGQRGTSVTFQIYGRFLQRAKVLLSGQGISVRALNVNPAGDSAQMVVDIAPDAPVGPREVRLATANENSAFYGATPPFRIWVDVFPELQEVEPNDDSTHAQILPREPHVVNARIQATNDIDMYAVDAQAGETWTFDCNAARIGSNLDPVLVLKDSAGRVVKSAQSVWGSDPRLIFSVSKAGRYFLSIYDSQFHGGGDYPYRLTAGILPVVTGFLPRGGKSGQTVSLLLESDKPGSNAPADVTVPTNFLNEQNWTALSVGGKPALAVPLLTNAAPTLPIRETPGDTLLTAFPAIVDGSFEKSALRRFALKAATGEHWIFDLLGRRIGSRIDGQIRVLDAAGKEIAANDDAIGKDAKLDWTAPAAGAYTLEISNVEGKIGPDCFYRLLAHKPAPDFQAYVNLDQFHIGLGGTASVPLSVERQDGFNGLIRLMFEGVPPGVRLRAGNIVPGKSDGEFTLSLPENSANPIAVLHLVMEATIDGKTVKHEIIPRQQFLPRYNDLSLVENPRYEFRPCALLPLVMVPRPEPFSLDLGPDAITLMPGQKVDILVHANRRPGANDEIKLEIRNLPDRITQEVKSIPANQSEGHVILIAAPDAPAALSNLIIQGKLGAAVQPAPAITLTVAR